ncbi:hypothetical protein SAMN05216191_11791 [Paenibacillus jilunlii]|uniref:Galactose oxidase n=1 Tax=Paenibacillus jilunlii TaxID=682956 RepID=A0A1G9VPE1_9BACL|nr:galactose oxidase [Paenibacillus jilunlii]SDM73990.1 hypothetical protein SAMN05216191_11791 [Paenibacillus jilunlii]
MEEVNDFMNWYENKQSSTGMAFYAINKHANNKGPFTSRKDYEIFDKILTFEVSEHTVVYRKKPTRQAHPWWVILCML